MKKKLLIIVLACVGFLPTLTKAQAQKEATVKVTGEVLRSLTVDEAELKKFDQTTVTRKDRDGKDHTYTGVILSTILQKAGVTLGPDLKGENLTKYLLVEASDGYQVVFALPELDKGYADRIIILADQVDGKPLLPADGPFRIIVTDEKKPARCIKQVTSLKILFAK